MSIQHIQRDVHPVGNDLRRNILETQASSNLILSPAVIAINTGYTRNYVNKRVRKLQEAGLLERVDEGYYEIAENERAYLEGKLEASDLEKTFSFR